MTTATTTTSAEQVDTWLTVCGATRPDIAQMLSERLEQRRMSGTFSLDFQRGVEDASFAAVKSGAFQTSPRRSEMLRKLCQIYGVEFKPHEISSHRKVIGPVIVGVKKFLFRVIKPLVGPAIEQQRNFNAAVTYLLIDLCNEAPSSNAAKSDITER